MTLSLGRRATHWESSRALVDHAAQTEWTYAELDEWADETAAGLTDAGVGRDDVVAVVSRNRPAFFSLFFAVRRLGATLAPISHRLVASTVESLLDRIEPTICLYESRFEDLIPEGVERESLTEFDERIDGVAGTGRASTVDRDPEEPLLYLHTGGTTGIPKVVVCTERQLEWNCITEAVAWDLGRDETIPLVLPLFHTGGWNLLTLPSLYVGGEVVVQREFDPDEVVEIVERYRATKLFAVAAIFRAIADCESFEAADLSSLEWCMSGGGPTPPSLQETYRDRGIHFSQGYGLTEGGPNNLFVDPTRTDAAEKAETVGRPFPDCEVRIVDDVGDTVEPGTIGELELRGPVAADRYLATSDGTFDGEWVSTGDLAVEDDDGDVSITGRTDNMFVSGGENVYPEEIENALDDHDAIEEVGAIGVPHERWGTTPKAVVVPAGAAGPPSDLTETLDAFARDRLPGYARPSAYAFVDELPRSGPGKLDREALAEAHGESEPIAGNGGETR
ncbi:class I adenylate-forming enzyme family protein [Halovivax gelatinilyticus]|uniref:class I adenylate-forming enzyme family protein n=1 Tax=Halovivax gelatinilyticus TaxID=2961597 RepID=UPI0020CA6BFE|nr:AMP-binding protein [Halovivax gelatinilyticus]